jgi:ketosteroid isomerase-like protein
MRPNVPAVRGTAAIREYFFSVLDSGFGEVEFETTRVETFGEVAYEAGRCKMLVPTLSGKRREERGKYLMVLARQNGGDWKILSDCWLTDLSLVGGAESEGAKTASHGAGVSIRAPRKGP